ATFQGNARRFGSSIRAELCEDVVHVALHSAFTDEQGAGDFFVALAACHQSQDFQFAAAEFGALHSLGELRADHGRNIVFAVVDDADAVNQVLEASILQQI